jgi:MFS transporter, PAT family, beta-lactamase induction signal transducer AmpG
MSNPEKISSLNTIFNTPAYRLFVVLFLGFASGIPLALTAGAMQAWLTMEGMDITTIGFLGLVALPYTFKFLWAPLMDRFEPRLFGRRRGWIVLVQLVIATGLFFLSKTSPTNSTQIFGAIALLVAFSSASLDVVIDAYRADLLPPNERGLGSSFTVLGYRVAIVISGGITFIWAQQWGSWPQVYMIMAMVMVTTAVLSSVLLPRIHADFKPLDSDPKRELVGFFMLLLGVAVGFYSSEILLTALSIDSESTNNWERLFFVLTQVTCALGLGLWLARKSGFATLNSSLETFFTEKSAVIFLLLIVLYKIGDAFAMSLTTAFLMRGMGFEAIEVGIASKTIGLLATIVGAMLGGFIMMYIRLSSALLVFGVLQLVSNLGYYLLAESGKGAWGTIEIPAFNLLITKLTDPTNMDLLLLSVMGTENLSGGMGTAALLALLMGLCNKKFSATHFALLSAIASIARVFVGPFSGVIAEQLGWPGFFLSSLVIAAPGVLLVFFMRNKIDSVIYSSQNSG